jgi:hypothetical protein
MNTDTPIIEDADQSNTATISPADWHPAPRPCKIMPRQKKSTKGPAGAFGKAKNMPANYGLKNQLVDLLKKARIQLATTGDIHPPTREAFDRLGGEGFATQVLYRLLGEEAA